MDNNYPIINSKVNNSIKDLSGNNEVRVSNIIDNEVEVKDENFKYNKNEESNEKKRKRKKHIKLYFSFRHTVYLITLWLIFLISFIIGFIVHFDTVKNVTASSIIWTFSIVICFFSVLYTYNYYRCVKARNEEELQKHLRYFPCQ